MTARAGWTSFQSHRKGKVKESLFHILAFCRIYGPRHSQVCPLFFCISNAPHTTSKYFHLAAHHIETFQMQARTHGKGRTGRTTPSPSSTKVHFFRLLIPAGLFVVFGGGGVNNGSPNTGLVRSAAPTTRGSCGRFLVVGHKVLWKLYCM